MMVLFVWCVCVCVCVCVVLCCVVCLFVCLFVSLILSVFLCSFEFVCQSLFESVKGHYLLTYVAFGVFFVFQFPYFRCLPENPRLGFAQGVIELMAFDWSSQVWKSHGWC